MTKRFITFGCTLILFIAWPVQAECIITMTYKDGAKLPFIAKAPDNRGVYQTLFNKATKQIGCSLEIVRSSKKRVHQKLSSGQLDFYPGASFSHERSKYLYYIENGFETGEVGLTTKDVPDIRNYLDVKNLDLTWLMELGGSKERIAQDLLINVNLSSSMGIRKVKTMLLLKRAGFYVSDKEPADYYLHQNHLTSYESIGLKIHPDCCGGLQPMYMGFSRHSPHFKEIKNPNFDDSKESSPTNSPTLIDPDCVAAKLSEALLELKKSGETQRIYNSYFNNKELSNSITNHT